jgi:tRNA 2-thiocytidine biosynthesis protein TtcA
MQQRTSPAARRLLGQISEASREFSLIEPGDRILVGMSGGKDSYTLLDLLRVLQTRTPFSFSLIAVNVDQGHPGFPSEVLPTYLGAEGYEFEIIKEDTYSIVTEKIPESKTYCSLCSRLRRGILYNAAVRLGATKIALGHHREDATETLLLNAFYSGQLKAMPARLQSDDGRNTVIRPLIYSSEKDIAEYAKEQNFPIIPCDLCGSQENLKRQKVKRLIQELDDENPNVRGNLLAALRNVRPSHLLDPNLTSSVAAPGADAVTGCGTPAQNGDPGVNSPLTSRARVGFVPLSRLRA